MEEIKKWIKVWVLVFVALTYCHFIPSKIPKGKFRLISVIPILYLFIILPWNLNSTLLGCPTTLFLVWLGNFNLLLFSFGKGPLSPKDRPISFSNFLALACLPIKIKQTSKKNNNPSLRSSETAKPSLNNCAIKVLVFTILTIGCAQQNMHPKLLLFCYCGSLYIGLEFTLLAVGVTTAKVLYLEIEPPFHSPYLSTSLQDFWGRRWNLVISNILRLTVYESVKKCGQLPAQLATFLVSGLMHEIICFYLKRVNPTWEITSFFLLQGFCVYLEVKVKKLVKGRWSLPPMVSIPLTVGFLMITSSWLLFPPLIQGRFDVKSRREIVAFVDYVKISAASN